MISLSPTVALVVRSRRRSVFVVPSLSATVFWTLLLVLTAIGGIVARMLVVWTLPLALLCGPFVFTRLVAFSRGKWSVWLAVGPFPIWRQCVATHAPDFIGIELHRPDEDDLDLVPRVFHHCVVEGGSLARVYCSGRWRWPTC
ncbi:MAG: hypothetical protein HS111_36545 [Kofleriaceae bacterium]|nr:hypothetical protein [Kofleriaceae bacterium]MCL4225754.1 hypothetical protein [Myxococcales bacterium]